MSYILKILVQMPDGTYQRLPIAQTTISGFMHVVKEPTKKEAKYWAEQFLANHLVTEEAK